MGVLDENVILDENEIIPGAFVIYKSMGCWRPLSWPDNKMLIYNAYTGAVVVTLVFANSTEALYFFCNVDRNFSSAITDDICVVLPAFFNVIKLFVFLNSRKQVIRLINSCFNPRWNAERNAEEKEIRNDFHRYARRNVTVMSVVVLLCLFSLFLSIYFDDQTHGVKLPVNAWYPFNTETPVKFWITYIFQTYAGSVMSAGYVANTCLILGFMLQICTQLRLLRSRICGLVQAIQKERKDSENEEERPFVEHKLIIECVKDHKSVFRFTKEVNDTFSTVMFFQFFSTMVVTCITVHQLSVQSVWSLKFITSVTIILFTLIEVFFLCWYGNEIILRSLDLSDAIYEMDWTEFHTSSKKYLIMMQTCTLKPIKLSGGPVVIWNLDTFIKIIKLSYSAINVLQRTSS